MILISVISLVALVALGAFIFIKVNPEFGGKPNEEQLKQYSSSPNFEQGKFTNAIPTNMDMSFSETVGVMYEFFKGAPGRSPDQPLPLHKIDSIDIAKKSDTLTRLTWFGHSTFLLEIRGKNILIDPMFGQVPAPHPLLGSKRFNEELPITIEELPTIDVVIFSHDHYDHLDYGSVQKLKSKVDKFYVPLGLDAHLTAWGVAPEKITAVDWWQKIKHDDLTFISTPARHFSGRGVTDRFNTLWCSWVIKSGDESIYFSGDSGFGDHFKEIGEKYGPFDFAMMECGQYNEKWPDIHMMPEETAQAAVDIKAKVMMPIHWGAFRLAMHSWTDPVERVTKKAAALGMPVATPEIGYPIIINDMEYPKDIWW
ncbi:MAG: MBL fold metallo-hydrolase [Fulvivirga sp.]